MRLNRQKVILNLLKEAGRPVGHTELVKWCFLLSEESPSRGGPSFYQFVPYNYGPFSFCLYRDMDEFVNLGVVREVSEEKWELDKQLGNNIDGLSRQIRQDIREMLYRFGKKRLDQLTSYVYKHHGWYTINSNKRKLQERPVASLAVYTAGYEGLQIEGFLNMLLVNGISRIIDIRNNPIARRYGFHKSTLGRLSAKMDIDYFHIPELGIQSELRQNLSTQSDYQQLFTRYKQRILKTQTEPVCRASELMLERPSVLVCRETDPSLCHRSRTAEVIREKTGLSIDHLAPTSR